MAAPTGLTSAQARARYCTESSSTSALTVSGALTTNSTATTLTNSGGAQFTVSGNIANTAGNLMLQALGGPAGLTAWIRAFLLLTPPPVEEQGSGI